MDLDQPNNGLPMEDTLIHDMPDIGNSKFNILWLNLFMVDNETGYLNSRSYSINLNHIKG